MEKLSDFIENYPLQNERNFQESMTNNYEFSQFASLPNEKLTSKYYNHQMLVHQFLEKYDNLAIFDDPGTGKTLTVIGYVDKILQASRNKTLDNDKSPAFKHAYILVKNSTHALEIKKQIICKVSDRYNTDDLKAATSDTEQKTRVNKILKNAGYVFKTYGVFCSEIRKKFWKITDPQIRRAKLREAFSDIFIWIDEVHNLSTAASKSDKKDDDDEEDEGDEYLDDEEEDEDIKKEIKEGINKEYIYEVIYELFHAILRSKKVISSATPMINDFIEITKIMNLLLPENGFIPNDMDFRNFDKYEREVFFNGKVTSEELKNEPKDKLDKLFKGALSQETLRKYINEPAYLEPFFRGRCTYIQNSNPYVNKISEGISTDNELQDDFGNDFQSKIKLLVGDMSDHQSDGYMAACNKEGNNNFSVDKVQAANMVYPDKSYGRKGFNKYIAIDNGKYIRTKEFDDYLFRNGRDRENVLMQIKNLSIKFYNIIIEVIEMETSGGYGYVYMESVKGSGLIALGLCLDAVGYKQFNPKTNIYKSNQSSSSVNSFCKDIQVKKELSESINLKTNRYAILQGKTSESDVKNVLEACNSKENIDGGIIRILLISRIGRDSISILNVKKIFLGQPEWNESAMEQALFRGIRVTSHMDIINRKMLNGEELKANVYVYREAINSFEDHGKTYDSIDLIKYFTAEIKDRGIRKIKRLIKIFCMTCEIHHERNRISSDKDYTQECDYDICEYKCFDTHNSLHDGDRTKNYKTYILNYFTANYPEIKSRLQELFRNYSKFTLEEIYELIGDKFLKEHIIMTLEHIISKREIIYNRFGFVSFLSYDSNILFLINDFPKKMSYDSDLSYYNDKIITTSYNELELVYKEIGLSKNENINDESKLNDYESSLKNFEALEGTFKVDFFEKAFNRYVNNKMFEIDEYVIDKYKNFIFKVNVNLADKLITEKIDKLTKTRKGPKEKTPWENKKLTQDEYVEISSEINSFTAQFPNNFIYVHTLETALKSKNSNYADNSNIINVLSENQLRYYNNGKWDTFDKINNFVYVKIIQCLILNLFERSYLKIKNEKYIFMNINNSLKILNYSVDYLKNKKAAGNGVECSSKNKTDLQFLFNNVLDALDISGDYKEQCIEEFRTGKKGEGSSVVSKCKVFKDILENEKIILNFSL
jgi:hypothetical protein